MNDPCLIRSKYLELFREVSSEVELTLLRKNIDVSLRVINSDVLELWAKSWEHKYDDQGRKVWDWKNVYNKKFSRCCKRVDLAIYRNEELIGLAIGRISKSRTVVRLEYIQRSSSEKILKGHVLPIVILYYAGVAKRLRSSHLAIVNPINDYVVGIYKKSGFNYNAPFNKRMKHIMYRAI